MTKRTVTIPISDIHRATGIPAAAVLKAMKAGLIPRHSPDLGGNTLVDPADVAQLRANA